MNAEPPIESACRRRSLVSIICVSIPREADEATKFLRGQPTHRTERARERERRAEGSARVSELFTRGAFNGML